MPPSGETVKSGEKMKSVHTAILCKIGLLLLGLSILFIPAETALALDKLPAFSLMSAVDGKKVSSRDFRGKTLLITFFTTWCPPCRQEIPVLIELQKEFSPNDFSVIGLSMDETGPKAVIRLIEKEGINYPVLMADREVARDFGGVFSVPTSFLVNREGKVVRRYPGYAPRAMLEKDIKEIL
jgi:thiol-disulfide isomerase/thioredoxin